MDSSHFVNNFKRTINSPATRANMNEPGTQHVYGAGAQAILDGWSRSLKFGFRVHTETVCGASDSELYK